VVSPDPGGFHRAEALRDALEQGNGSVVELAMLGKHRKAGVVRSEAFVGEVDGRIAVIVDDMIVTGTTLVRAAEACRRRGAAAVHAMATHAVFGDRVPVSSLKGNLGHTLGACGALELAFTISMLREGWIAPTRNLEVIDPACAPLDYVRGEPRRARLERVMCNKFAFGGINTSLVLAAP
jgi:3-oxoacyl-[acyl-carrier-protein] synthase II